MSKERDQKLLRAYGSIITGALDERGGSLDPVPTYDLWTACVGRMSRENFEEVLTLLGRAKRITVDVRGISLSHHGFLVERQGSLFSA